MSLKGVPIFSSAGHFVQWSGTILAVLIEGQPRNLSKKLFSNRYIGIGDVILRLFYFYLWRPFRSVERKNFSNYDEDHARTISVKLF